MKTEKILTMLEKVIKNKLNHNYSFRRKMLTNAVIYVIINSNNKIIDILLMPLDLTAISIYIKKFGYAKAVKELIHPFEGFILNNVKKSAFKTDLIKSLSKEVRI